MPVIYTRPIVSCYCWVLWWVGLPIRLLQAQTYTSTCICPSCCVV